MSLSAVEPAVYSSKYIIIMRQVGIQNGRKITFPSFFERPSPMGKNVIASRAQTGRLDARPVAIHLVLNPLDRRRVLLRLKEMAIATLTS